MLLPGSLETGHDSTRTLQQVVHASRADAKPLIGLVLPNQYSNINNPSARP
jgi:hypothetical protein